MQMSALLTKMLIFVVMIAMGWIGARKKILTPAFSKGASWLLLNVFLVASIGISIISTDASKYTIRELGLVLLMSSVIMLLLYLIPAVLVRVIPVDKTKETRLELLMSIVNNMFVALPVAETLYGSEAVFILAISCIPFNVLAYTYGLARLRGGKISVRLRDILNVPLMATIVATVVFMLRIPVPAPIRSVLSGVSGGTLPLSMLIVGATLGGADFGKAIRDKTLYLLSFVRFLLVPAAAWLLLKALGTEEVLANTLIIMAASPCAIIVTAFSIQNGYDGEYTSEGILFTTLLSIVTLPITAYLLLL